jgi:hypothetical protein
MNTGMHIINTTNDTQVVKVRLRRGTDSKDALDFNLVMSPRDEWTANIGAGGPYGVLVTTNDTTCTVPAFPEGGAEMPETYSEGATEGYVEIIAMAQADKNQPIAIAAKHTAGVPANCKEVEQNFYRVDLDDINTNTVRGTHTSNLTSRGYSTTLGIGCAATAASSGACTGGGASNLSKFTDSDDNALKVSFMLTDPNGGLEAGDNAVMVEGFADAAMMTNQQPISFGTNGVMKFDPLNFELPNLAYGAFASSNDTRKAAMVDSTAVNSLTDGSMWAKLSDALDADSVSNDWAAFSTADGTVHADWVVTLPGQYVMTNPLCDTYKEYEDANDTAGAACTNTAAVAAYSASGGADRNQLPLIVSTSYIEDALTESNMNLWDREELVISGKDIPPDDLEDELDFSPGGVAGEAGSKKTVGLPYEVNVIAFGEADQATAVESNLKLSVSQPAGSTSDRGWGRLDIMSSNPAPERWNLTDGVDDEDVLPTGSDDENVLDAGTWTPTEPTDVAVVGFAIWQRSFAAQAGNYGRMIEHSTITSDSATR